MTEKKQQGERHEHRGHVFFIDEYGPREWGWRPETSETWVIEAVSRDDAIQAFHEYVSWRLRKSKPAA